MTVGNPEQFKFKLITSGREDVDNRKPCNLNPLTLEKLLKWIDAQRLEEPVKIELKKSASNYPHQALGTWQKNYSKHLSSAQAKLKKTPKPKPPIQELGEEMENRNERESYENENHKNRKHSEFDDDLESNFTDEIENPS